MAPQPRTLTRRELYDLVWSTPMSKLAGEFGLSDVGLKKVCDRHRVPAPGRGYWAKVEAGQKPKRVLFTETTDARLNRIEIRPGLVDLPEPVRQVIEVQRAERRLAAARAQPKLRAAPSYDPVVDTHPAVRRTAQALRRCKPSDASVRASGEGLCGVQVGRESIERAIYVLDGLARALDDKGTPLTVTGEAMRVAVGPDAAVFGLKERTRTVPHVPTEAELAEEARRDEQRERHWRNPGRWPAPPYGPVYPEKDLVWTGELSIQIEGYSDGVRRTWADGRMQRLEELVPSIVDGIEVLLAARKAEREKREEEARRRAELEHRRQLARARHEREAARLRFVEELMKLTREVEELRSWLVGVEQVGELGGGGQAGRMYAWARARLLEMEARLEPGVVEQRLSEAKLFPEPGADELHDPLGEPPPSRWY